MARHYVRLPTMVQVVTLQRSQSSMGQLLEALAGATEFSNIMLRRSEGARAGDVVKQAGLHRSSSSSSSLFCCSITATTAPCGRSRACMHKGRRAGHL